MIAASCADCKEEPYQNRKEQDLFKDENDLHQNIFNIFEH